MELLQEIKQRIENAKNICIIPSDTDQGEGAVSALALFYTLKELGKNVNLIIDSVPERFHFLVPSLDFISTPKNFVIAIPREVANISQVYYEKNETDLKIHLTADKGNIKKDAISFYFSETRPDLVITLGIQDFHKKLSTQLDSFGFILDVPIINIDNEKPSDNEIGKNTKFGTINIVEHSSLAQMSAQILNVLGANIVKQNAANCLLAGLMMHYDHFKSPHTSHEVFQLAAELIKKGAQRDLIVNHLYKKATKEQIEFLSEIFGNLTITPDSNISFALLPNKFQHITEPDISGAVERIDTIGIQNDLLVLWESHASDPVIKGFFYSKNQDLTQKIAKAQQQEIKNNWVGIALPQTDIHAAKEHLLNVITS